MRTKICIPYSISQSASLPLIRYRNICGRYGSYFPTLNAFFEANNMRPYRPPNFTCLEIFAMVSFFSDIYNFIIQKCEVYFRVIFYMRQFASQQRSRQAHRTNKPVAHYYVTGDSARRCSYNTAYNLMRNINPTLFAFGFGPSLLEVV